MTISMQVAREHHAEGERILAIAHGAADAKPEIMSWDAAAPHIAALASLASTHFAASLSATGIISVDPPEGPEPAER